MRRIAAHRICFSPEAVFPISYVELLSGDELAGVYPLTEEIAGTTFINGAILMVPEKQYTDIQELTPLILNELVERIVVHQAQGLGKNRTQELEIHYNFIGTLDTPEVAALPQSVTIDTRQGVAVEYITRKAV